MLDCRADCAAVAEVRPNAASWLELSPASAEAERPLALYCAVTIGYLVPMRKLAFLPSKTASCVSSSDFASDWFRPKFKLGRLVLETPVKVVPPPNVPSRPL